MTLDMFGHIGPTTADSGNHQWVCTHLELKPSPRGGIFVDPSRLAVYVEQRQSGDFDIFLPLRYRIEDDRIIACIRGRRRRILLYRRGTFAHCE